MFHLTGENTPLSEGKMRKVYKGNIGIFCGYNRKGEVFQLKILSPEYKLSLTLIV